MNGLDSTLGALAFNPINLSPLLSSLFNNIWALVAIFTATAMISLRHLRNLSPPNTTLSMSTAVVDGDEVVAETEAVAEMEAVGKGNNKNHNKFFHAYYDDENEGVCINDEAYDADEEDELVVVEGSGDDVEVVDKWAVEISGCCCCCCCCCGGGGGGSGVVGWYEFQDRSVIDGSVVKLWDGNNSPRGNRDKRSNFTLVSVSKVESVR